MALRGGSESQLSVQGALSRYALRPFFASLAFFAPPMQDTHDTTDAIQEPRLWSDGRWTARVIKNDDDDGWAVAMYLAGESEPALVGPWTMGRDKKNPKPLDQSAFLTLVKTAREFVRRSEQQLHASLHQSMEVAAGEGRVTVYLDIEPDEENPTATLTARDEGDDVIAQVKVSPAFKLSRASAVAWVERGYAKP